MTRWFRFTLMFVAVAVLPLRLRANDLKESKTMDTTAFTADLYAQLATRKANLFFSPASIETALAMTYAGAKGSTAEQMAKTLHFAGSAEEVSASFATLLKTLNNPPEVVNSFDNTGKPVKTPAYQLIVANALWGQQGYPFQPDFVSLVQKDYAGYIGARRTNG